MDNTRKRQYQFSGAYLLLALAALVLIQGIVTHRTRPRSVPMSDLLAAIRTGQVSEVLVREKDVVAQLRSQREDKQGDRLVAVRLPGVDETPFVRELQERGVRFSGVIEETPLLQTFLLSWLLPIGVLVGIWLFVMRKLQRGGPLSIGRSKAKIYDEAQDGQGHLRGRGRRRRGQGRADRGRRLPEDPGALHARSARASRRACCSSARRAPARRCSRAPSPARRACPSSRCPAPSSSRCSSASAPRACATCSSRPRSAPPASSSSTSSTRSASRAPAPRRSRGHDEREQTLNQLLVEMDGFDRHRRRDHHGRDQPARGARPRAAARRPLRPPGARRQPRPRGPRGDPRRCTARGEARRRRQPQAARPAHARHGRARTWRTW